MWEHFLLDNPPKEEEKEDGKLRDDSYDTEESKLEYSSPEAKEEGRLPLQDFESFADPEFDKAWNEDEDSPSEVISENPPNEGAENFDLAQEEGKESDISIHDEDKWEEV